MRVEVELGTFNSTSAARWVDRILGRVEDGWHIWWLVDAEHLEDTAWWRLARPALQQLARAAARAVLRWQDDAGSAPGGSVHTRTVRVAEGALGPGEWQKAHLCLAPEPACRFLDEHLRVLVENREADGAFLAIVIERLGSPELRELVRLSPPPLTYDSLGGSGQMVDDIDTRVREAKAQSRPARLLVVIDSDARWPGDRRAPPSNIKAACDRAAVPCHVLRKRCADNYLPGELLGVVVEATRRRFVRAVCALSRELHDHFPLAKGLAGVKENTERQRYAALDETTRHALDQGLGRAVKSAWSTHGDGVTAGALEQRDGRGELREITALIASWL
ncbi:MAG: hypothetical protein HY744_14515 [Deltaproteobacteria bacterium]|nr:hypothetical protein [Deltaproteobacteria bacterium]